MEEKINIAKILRYKPQGTKLYANAFGELSIEDICAEYEIGITLLSNIGDKLLFYNDGRFNLQGEPILVPSKEMRDWEKFSWKKGDVLKNTAYEERVIFDGFLNDDYTYFKGKHPLDCSDKFNIKYHEECNCFTGNYRLESTDAAQTYINIIEERLGGKLNSDTLEIEKTQPEFKVGDIAFADYGNRQNVFIVSDKTNLSEGYNSFISLDLSGLTLNMGYRTSFFKSNLCKLRLATEEEKKQLFSALANKGKAWDSEKKKIVDLKPKVDELKPFDKVLVRDGKDEIWEPAFFFRYLSQFSGYNYQTVGGEWRVYCIPYIGNESLLGTSKDVEG